MTTTSARHLGAMAGVVAIGAIGYAAVTSLDGAKGQVCVLVLIWTIATTGLNVIQGLGGYPSIVQASFYGGGAYVSAIMLDRGWQAIPAVAAALVVTMAAGFLIGIVFARTRGQYFAIGTLFSCAVVTLILTNERGLTGGPLGKPVRLAFSTTTTLRLLCASVTVSLAIFYWLSRSRFGERLRSIREDEDLAIHLGVPTARVKLIAMVISAGFGAWAGVLIAQRDGLIAPSQFGIVKSFLMFVAIGLGGYGRLLTPLIGSVLVIGIPELLDLTPGVSEVALGLLFIAVTLLVPGGIIGGVEQSTRRLAARMPHRRSAQMHAVEVTP